MRFRRLRGARGNVAPAARNRYDRRDAHRAAQGDEAQNQGPGRLNHAFSDTPWYADGLRFTCTRCGNCCTGPPGFVWVGDDEVRRLAEFTGMSLDQFRQQHTRRIGLRWSLLERPNGDCEFLARDADGHACCTVHPVRPLQCRTWPFWDSNLRSPRTWQITARNCPGMNAGAFHPLPVIQAQVQQARDAQLDL
ncbi:MAG: YkgJ family cysteine cluster protein [Phycisphaerae bacterium]